MCLFIYVYVSFDILFIPQDYVGYSFGNFVYLVVSFMCLFSNICRSLLIYLSHRRIISDARLATSFFYMSLFKYV